MGLIGANEHLDDPVLSSDPFEKWELREDSDAALSDLVTCSAGGCSSPRHCFLLGGKHTSGKRITDMARANTPTLFGNFYQPHLSGTAKVRLVHDPMSCKVGRVTNGHDKYGNCRPSVVVITALQKARAPRLAWAGAR